MEKKRNVVLIGILLIPVINWGFMEWYNALMPSLFGVREVTFWEILSLGFFVRMFATCSIKIN